MHGQIESVFETRHGGKWKHENAELCKLWDAYHTFLNQISQDLCSVWKWLYCYASSQSRIWNLHRDQDRSLNTWQTKLCLNSPLYSKLWKAGFTKNKFLSLWRPISWSRLKALTVSKSRVTVHIDEQNATGMFWRMLSSDLHQDFFLMIRSTCQ